MLAVLCPALCAADKELKGSIEQMDLAGMTVTIRTQEGRKALALVGPTRVLDAKGTESKEGLKDKRLAAGAEVRLVLTVSGKAVREIHLSVAAEPAVKARPGKETGKSDGKGIAAKVLSVQADSRVVQVQVEGGEKLDLKLGAEVKFLGPKGGVSTKGIKDDRLVAGAEVRVVMDGQTVKEIHLPYRK